MRELFGYACNLWLVRLPILTAVNLKGIVFSESELLYDWRFTVNYFVLVTSPLRFTTSSFFFNWALAVIVSDERMGLSFTIAAGPRQRSHSQVRVPRDSWPHFTASVSRLPQPRGTGFCIYVPLEQSDKFIPPGTGFLFVSSYYSQGWGEGIRTRLHRVWYGLLEYGSV
jgi:hypothetical protein